LGLGRLDCGCTSRCRLHVTEKPRQDDTERNETLELTRISGAGEVCSRCVLTGLSFYWWTLSFFIVCVSRIEHLFAGGGSSGRERFCFVPMDGPGERERGTVCKGVQAAHGSESAESKIHCHSSKKSSPIWERFSRTNCELLEKCDEMDCNLVTYATRIGLPTFDLGCSIEMHLNGLEARGSRLRDNTRDNLDTATQVRHKGGWG
jgi:hypothetical protein